jgi:ankyrin repeat protein
MGQICSKPDVNNFIEACETGNLTLAKRLFQLNPGINISAFNEYAFRRACEKGHLHVAQWMLLIKPTINISAEDDYAFRRACLKGHLYVAKWLLLISKEKGQCIHISAENEQAFRWACRNGHLEVAKWLLLERGQCINISADNENAFVWACLKGHLEVAKWLQSLKPHLYVFEYDKNEDYICIHYRIRDKEEANWEQRKYLVWLASKRCPEQNRNNLLYKLPSDVSRMVIGFV